VVLQLAFYACAAVLILFTALVAGKEVSLDLLLSWRSLRGDVTVGWMLGLVWMLNSLIWYVVFLPDHVLVSNAKLTDSVIFLLLLIARSKLIPDFALTIHFFHLIITSLYSHSIPTHWFWWALQIASAALMTWLGVWSCQWRELRPIQFGANKAQSRPDPQPSASQLEEGPSEGEVGVGRGRGRGRGKDGAGQYEMVSMSETDKQERAWQVNCM